MKTKIREGYTDDGEQRVAGHVNFSDDGDTAYLWTRTTWCASMTIERGDMDPTHFRLMVDRFAALAKIASRV